MKTVEVRTKVWEAFADRDLAEKTLAFLPGINKRLVEHDIWVDDAVLHVYVLVSDVGSHEADE